MNAPICDFLAKYIEKNPLRLHMPGHKGAYGFEKDITEVEGADSLYNPRGIIRESEQNASRIFDGETFYSTEGSSHCIRAMLYLFCLYCREEGKSPRVLASRNAHKTFTSAAALLDIAVSWIYPKEGESYLSCSPDIKALSERLSAEAFGAVYITSPDYLGKMADIKSLAALCREKGVLLLVDNAHGAYLRFLSPSLHPLALGADMCCDSAHKTLPVLTGGAYLHISKYANSVFSKNAKEALSLFGSTSPSYLVLESLDRVNRSWIQNHFVFGDFCQKVAETKKALVCGGYTLVEDEPFKITVAAKKYGYEGGELAKLLDEKNIVCEFYDKDYMVLMLTPEIGEEGLKKLSDALLSIPKKAEITIKPPAFQKSEAVVTPREALFLPRETVYIWDGYNRVLAETSVSCPPAVPILMCGERITEDAMKAFRYYGIDEVTVLQGM